MSSAPTETNVGIVFTFPGQGSYSHTVLHELLTSYPQTEPYFHQANDICRELLKGDFLSLITSTSSKEHDDRFSAAPDLDQIGIYLTEVLISKILMQSGVRPALLVGHSFGELAALATAGVYSFETGLRIVCQRVLALSMAQPGGMAAISCDLESAKRYLEEFGNTSLEISVVNQPRQTVLSGPRSELEQLSNLVNGHSVSLTFLKSRYPYHSSLLARAVAPFRTALETCSFRPATIPVYLCMEGMLYSPGSDLAQILSSQFIRRLDFKSVVTTLYQSGYRDFIECGAGNIVTRLIGQNLIEQSGDVRALSVTPLDGNVQQGLLKLSELGFGKIEAPIPTDEMQGPAASMNTGQLLESLSLVVKDMSQMVEDTSNLIKHVADSLLSVAPTDPSPSANPFPVNPVASAESGPAPQTSVQVTSIPLSSSPTEKSSSPDTRPVGAVASGSNGNNGFGGGPQHDPQQQAALIDEECAELPIAIVSLGCVLPGARDPEQYWSNILSGVSGVSNLVDTDPSTALDFLVQNNGGQVKIVPDKTYTLLHGSIPSVPYDAALLSAAYTEDQFESLTKGQKILALALAQTISRLKVPLNPSQPIKLQCILGATADGSKEYDDALFVESVAALLENLDEPEDLRHAFADTLEDISGYKNGDAGKITQHKLYSSVVEKLLGNGIPMYVVDTACSSSLYSTYLGIKSLQDFECDLVLAGGVFAPGPANNTLFAQFRGLTHIESRPFDTSADGVVFGDGAGIVALKRLPDAMADDDRILGVIRGIGLSSDGKSPSINVPQSKGQGLAIQSAYERSGVDTNTIQYVEAHATATTVGDAVEFSALREFLKRDPGSPPVELGSVKALIGHTGWAAGAASMIKICKALEARVICRQYNYVMPSPEIDLAHSQFSIPRTSYPWPDNVAGYPRRAAINGFGFGGTNAHLILEEFDASYHRNLCANFKVEKKVAEPLAVIGVGSLFPGVDGSMSEDPLPALHFKRESLHLPARKMLLPDVTEHMDASQYLAALAAEKTFSTMPETWPQFKNSIGVVLGLESKTERGRRANERIFADRLRRQVREHNGNGKLSNADRDRIVDKLVERICAQNVASGPYTLPGLMPNVTAGRIANLFDLKGPNIVVDMADNSTLQALFVARQLLAHDSCKIVLAGGVNANNVSHGNQAEAVFLLALTTLETARREGLPVLSTLSLLESEERNDVAGQEVTEIDPGRDYRGARGAPEILRAIKQSREKSLRSVFKQLGSGALAGKRLIFDPATAAREETAAPTGPGTYAYVQGTPIRYFTPQLMLEKAVGEPRMLKGHKILFLTDQADHWLALENSGALAAFEYNVVCPSGTRLAKSLPVDLTSEDTIRNSLTSLATLEFDTVIAIKSLEGQTRETLLLNNSGNELNWIDLLFAVCRHSYERIRLEKISVISLCLGAYRNEQLDPFTGVASGFMKSLSRELDGAFCRAINTDEVNLFKALRQVEIELGHARGEVEVCYRGGTRSTFALAPVENLAKDAQPYLDSDSVVIATGGARGVTAVLVEELLRRFGCRVIALGRTEPSLIPAEVLEMDEQGFQNYEAQFYKDQLARDKTRKIKDLKREYLAYRAANEVAQVTRRMQAISEKYEYHGVDITSETAIDELVKSTYQKYGRVDLILHGAGVQVSTALTKKSLSDFQKIVGTKLGGLSHLYKACEKYGAGQRTHFHILTSVFSYMGNDGQPDYGAANEAMNRIAALMNSAESYWSSMAWLGWAGIGMTRDSEFAALAASRKLRGVTKEEGQQIFSAMMNGAPTVPINILLADGEIEYYKVAINTSAPTDSLPAPESPLAGNGKRDVHLIERELSVESYPYLRNHLVEGVPTMPGAFMIAVVGEAAQELRPNLKILSFEQAHFRRFIKVHPSRETRIRVAARVISEDDVQTLIEVRILSDFVHTTGVVLQKDILQHEIVVRMSATRPAAPKSLHLNGSEGRPLPDPYVMEGSPVRLSGPFNAIKNLTVGSEHRSAIFGSLELNGSDPVLSRIVLMDSLWRFGVIQIGPDNSLPVFVPDNCEVMKIYFDFAEFNPSKLPGTLTFSGLNPRLEGDLLSIGPVAVHDGEGNTLLVVEHGVCRRYGAVKNATLNATV